MTSPCPALAYVRDKKVGDKNLGFTSSASNKLPHPGQLREQAEFFFMHDAEKPVLPAVFEAVGTREAERDWFVSRIGVRTRQESR